MNTTFGKAVLVCSLCASTILLTACQPAPGPSQSGRAATSATPKEESAGAGDAGAVGVESQPRLVPGPNGKPQAPYQFPSVSQPSAPSAQGSAQGGVQGKGSQQNPAPAVSAANRDNAQRMVSHIVDLLNAGREEAASAEIQQVLSLDPGNRAALSLQRQIAADPAAVLGTDSFSYTVKRGDSMSVLASRFLNDSLQFYLLARYNDIKVPRQLAVGQTIKVPGRPPASTESVVVEQYSVPIPGPQSVTQKLPPPPSPLPPQVPPAPAQPPAALPPAASPSVAALPPAPTITETQADRWVRLGNQAQAAGDSERAMTFYHQAQAQDPNNADIKAKIEQTRQDLVAKYIFTARSAFAKQDLDGAIVYWDKVLGLDPSNATAKLGRQKTVTLRSKLNSLTAGVDHEGPTASTSPSGGPKPECCASISRYPTLEAPDKVLPGQEVAVQFWLAVESVTPAPMLQIKPGPHASVDKSGEAVFTLRTDPTTKRQVWTLDVALSAPGFTFKNQSSNVAHIKLEAVGDSTLALFNLIPDERFLGLHALRATLWHEGEYLASIARDITILAPASAAFARSAGPAPRAVSQLQATAAKNPAQIETDAHPADLIVWVRYDHPNRLGSGDIFIASPYLHEGVVTEKLKASDADDTPEWLTGWYRKFLDTATSRGNTRSAQLAEPPESKDKTIATMRGFGQKLYADHAPALFKRVLEQLIDDPAVKLSTIQIYSNNPLLPWELMYPVFPNHPEVEFLGTSFQVARWHADGGPDALDRPVRRLPLKNLIAIAPSYGSGPDLPAQREEIEYLARIPGFRREVARFDTVRALAHDPPSGIVHFAGHGEVKGLVTDLHDFIIYLEDGPLNVMTWRGIPRKAKAAGTFYFFNACDIGQAESVAGSVEGWAPAVLDSGAGGYVGGLWPVRDLAAAHFAERFYDGIRKGLATPEGSPVAAALQEARKRFFETGDPTYLAYVYYGDVNLRFTGVKP